MEPSAHWLHWNMSRDRFWFTAGRTMDHERNGRDDRSIRKDRNVSYESDEDAISRNLKRVYDQVADEPIPDSLQALLDRLKQDGSNA